MIAIESIPDAENHYRLGVQFLKNFYVSLDYQDNVIMIGLNNHGLNNGAHAVVDPDGKKNKEEPKKANYEILVLLIILMLSGILSILGFQKYKSVKKSKKVDLATGRTNLIDDEEDDRDIFTGSNRIKSIAID